MSQFESIVNRGEFFSNHYFDEVIAGDLGDLRSRWSESEERGEPTSRSRIKGAGRDFLERRGAVLDASGEAADRALARLHDLVLSSLGFEPDRQTWELKHNTEHTLGVPTAARLETSTGLQVLALEAADCVDVEQLTGTDAASIPGGRAFPGELLTAVHRTIDERRVRSVPKAIGEVFGADEPPRYVLVVAGAMILLAERAKWAEGRYLIADLSLAFDRNDTRAKGELETIAALFSTDALAPVDGQSTMETLVDNSTKHAVGVSKELRHGIRDSIEILVNEVIAQRDNEARRQQRRLFTRTDVDARDLTRQALRYLYRLIVLLYAESRPELGIVPVDDDAYVDGYSLDRLRELCLVDLDEKSATGTHLQQSLDRLYSLVNDGYHHKQAEQQLVFDADDDTNTRSHETYLAFPGLNAQLFDPASTPLINNVQLRNAALQQVLKNLMLTTGKRKGDSAGFISYAQLGINQLGAVYEGLMAYTGFYADTALYEVAKNGDPTDGTWMLPVADADEYPDGVFVTKVDERTGREERVLHEQGSFVFRLSGRDRQRSASYYTPEVLTECVVKHALAELLGLDDYAPEHGSSGITDAVDLLDLTICEPALGSGAFANEAINQLAAEYLRRRQVELGEVLDPERYRVELQKVKAHFALHQTYGVDLNATAVELAEVSLWLNCMYPGLQAPWFGLQLRAGNSLIGCRRATWRTSQLAASPWSKTSKGTVQPPVDRPLIDELGDDEIHHFLLPGHSWAAVADRKEAKELRPSEVERLKGWRKTILKAPKKDDAKRLRNLAAGVEVLWKQASNRIAVTQQGLRRPINVYGAPINSDTISRNLAREALENPDSPLGRLRTLMDVWVGLWFWPLDTGHAPPSWNEWLHVAEQLIRPDERDGLTGQLDLFADLDALLAADRQAESTATPVADLRERHPWLAVALDAAHREGAWHWELEFAPVFERGGFDLQVGNPPWVRLDWKDDLVLAEIDPWWGVTEKPSAASIKSRRVNNLSTDSNQRAYLAELASAEGVVEVLGSPILRPVLSGTRTNLYMVFMDTTWRHLRSTGTIGLLHPESHFTDPKAAELRRTTYGHLRRHFMFYNEFILFEEVDHHTEFSVNVSGREQTIGFAQAASLFTPSTIDRSLEHDGSGQVPGIKTVGGDWDASPHRQRILHVDSSVLADWAKLFDEPGTPAEEARLLRPVTTADLEALSALAAQPVRLADHNYHWTQGWNETNAKTDGTIRWETTVPSSWDDVILQGPHFTVATPFNKQPNEGCKNNLDYSDWDLETLPERVIPRTNYQRACDEPTYHSRLDRWGAGTSSDAWRLAWRKMTQPGPVRSLHACLVPPGPAHVGGVYSLGNMASAEVVSLAALWAALPTDYLVKVSGTANIEMVLCQRFPSPIGSFAAEAALRTLRLNCITGDYAPLWAELFDSAWESDSWTDPALTRSSLGDVGSTWTTGTPLRRDEDRWQALVELDALAALMLGLSAEQLCAMYRSQFAVLRKYEFKMVFDAEGRKICGYHQSAGYRQSQLQDEAKAGDRPKEWKNLWSLYEQYEADPDSVDWQGQYSAPFTRVDREAAMTRAYEVFSARHGTELAGS